MTVTQQLPADPGEWTLANAKQLLVDSKEIEANRPFIEGDHFQGGDGWIGPGPSARDQGYGDFIDQLVRVFLSKNVLDECCDRLASAIVGWEPRWGWIPNRRVTPDAPLTAAVAAEIADLEAALTDWWDRRMVHKALKQQVYAIQWAQQACWWVRVPSGLTDRDGRLNVTTIQEALDKIYVEVPDPELSTVYVDPNSKERIGIVFFSQPDGTEAAELSYVQDGKTVVRVVSSKDTTAAANDFQLHIPVFCTQLDQALITEQVRSLQRALNMNLTVLGKTVVDNAFVEKIFFNAMPPGEWVYEDDNKTRKAFIPKGRATGGRTDSFLVGTDYADPDGKVTIKDPSMEIRSPVDPSGCIKGSEYWYQAILEETRQDHVLINQTATPSGRSRDAAKGDFIDSTKDSMLQCEFSGRELLWTVVSMVEAFIGKPGQWTSRYRPVFKCRPNYGPLGVEEQKMNLDAAKEGFLSDQTAMALNGVDDVDAEQALIDAQPRAFLALSSQRGTAFTSWVTDLPREVALYMVGYSDAEIAEIMRRVNLANSADVSVDRDSPDPELNPDIQVPPAPVTGTGDPLAQA